MLGKTTSWRGEWTYGPRYMMFGLPVLGLPFIVFLDGLRDWPQQLAKWSVGTVAIVTLLYSGYLQERTNRLEFFTYYRVSSLVEGSWNRQMARYMLDWHLGAFCAELLKNKDNLDALPWVKELKELKIPAEKVELVKAYVREFIAHENYYWKMNTPT